jgi:restriction system protein
VQVTKPSDDEGIDVLAVRTERGEPTRLTIQVKKWSDTNPVGPAEVRELVGTMDHARATGGVLITTGRFTSGARKLLEDDPRLSGIERLEFITLLNEHCGANWYLYVDSSISMLKATATRR